MGKIKLNLVSGAKVEKPLISAFKTSEAQYVVLDNEMNGSMGLPIILVCKLDNDKLMKITDQGEWQNVKELLKNIIAGNPSEFIKISEEMSADDIYYTQLTLPVQSFDILKQTYASNIVEEQPVVSDAPVQQDAVQENVSQVPDVNPTVDVNNGVEPVIPQVDASSNQESAAIDLNATMPSFGNSLANENVGSEVAEPVIPTMEPVANLSGIEAVASDVAPQNVETPQDNVQENTPVDINIAPEEEKNENNNVVNESVNINPIPTPVADIPVMQDSVVNIGLAPQMEGQPTNEENTVSPAPEMPIDPTAPVVDIAINPEVDVTPVTNDVAANPTVEPVTPVTEEVAPINPEPTNIDINAPIDNAPANEPVTTEQPTTSAEELFKDQKEAFMQACENMFEAMVQKFQKELENRK